MDDDTLLRNFLASRGCDPSLLAGWSCTIGGAGVREAQEMGETSGCFISPRGKRFRSFEGVCKYLLDISYLQEAERAGTAMSTSASELLRWDCAVQGHRFEADSPSRRCKECKRIIVFS